MKITSTIGPVLLVSGQFDTLNDEGYRLRELETELSEVQECSIIPSFNYEDAIEIFVSRNDLGAVIIDWDIQDEDSEEKLPRKSCWTKYAGATRPFPCCCSPNAWAWKTSQPRCWPKSTNASGRPPTPRNSWPGGWRPW